MTRLKNIGVICILVMFVLSLVYDCLSGDLAEFFKETSWVGLIVTFFIFILMLVFLLNKFSKYKIFCEVMGWHKAPKRMHFDGASFSGKCPRCDKNVLRDSQGNWF